MVNPVAATQPRAYVPTSDQMASTEPTTRIASIDIVRGLVVVLMAIDHVRVFSGIPAGGPDPGVFFTRWITHFVAPAFVFLAGTAAFLYGRKANRGQLARFLATRGALLIVLELTLIRFFWTFNFDFANYLLAGVIWVIGWSMIALAALVSLPATIIGAFGVLMIAGHNIADVLIRPNLEAIQGSGTAPLWSIGYFAFEVWSTEPLVVLYALVPWVGVMAAGFAFGTLFTLDQPRRRRLLLQIGAGATIAFVLLRWLNVYGDPRPWEPAADGSLWASLRSFLNTTKYPASLAFLLMTLGPAILLLPFVESATSRMTRVLQTFGRVPMFYYLLHIPLIHLLAVGVSAVRSGGAHPWLFENHPMGMSQVPDGYMWPLWLLYLVTALAVTLLYFPCRWYADYKKRSGKRWLSYL